jgi:hypothetical protein
VLTISRPQETGVPLSPCKTRLPSLLLTGRHKSWQDVTNRGLWFWVMEIKTLYHLCLRFFFITLEHWHAGVDEALFDSFHYIWIIFLNNNILYLKKVSPKSKAYKLVAINYLKIDFCLDKIFER